MNDKNFEELKNIVEALDVELTESEMVQLAKDVTKARNVIRRLDVQFDEEKKRHKEAVIAQDHIIAMNLSYIERGYQPKDVEVKVIADWKEGVVRFIRTDTGEAYKVRPISEDERQQKIWRDEDAKAAKDEMDK